MAVDIAAVLTASIDEFKAKMGEADASVKGFSSSGSSSMQKLSAVGKGALLGIAGAAAVVGVAAVKAGDALEASQGALQAALKASGTSWDKVSGSVAASGQAATKYGYTQAQVDGALTLGVISTQNYGSAHKNLAVAVELAAAKHVSLSTAMQAVDKATTGNTRALNQLGISLPIAASNALKLKNAQDAVKGAQLEALTVLQQFPDAANASSSAHAKYEAALDKVTVAQGKLKDQQQASGQILDALSKRLGGQAAAAADTFAGKVAAMKAQGENLLATLGMKLIPVLEKLMTTIQGVVQWFEKHKTIALILAGIIGGALTVAIGIYIANLAKMAGESVVGAIKGLVLGFQELTGAELEADAAADANPLGLLVLAAVALAAVAIEVVKHWKAIATFFVGLWNDLKHYFDDGINFVKSHWRDFVEALVIILTGGVALIPVLILHFWSQISSFTQKLISDVVGFFTGLPGKIVAGLGDIVSTIWSGLTGAASWIDNNVIQPVVNYFTQLPANIVAGLGAIVTTIWQGLLTAATWVDTNVILPVVNYFVQLPGRIVAGLGDIVGTIFHALMSVGAWLDANVWGPIGGWFSGLPGRAATALGDIVGTAFSALTSIGSWLENNVWKPIQSFFSGLPGRIGKAAGNLLSNVTSGASSLVSKLNPFAVGGIVTSPTAALIGEAGPEAVIPLNDTQRAFEILGFPQGTSQPSLTGISSIPPSSAGGPTASVPLTFNLVVNGTTFSSAIFNDLWAVMLQRQRSAVTLNLGG